MCSSISILGSCCSRDIFGLQPNTEHFRIDAFTQSCSPLAITESSPLLRPIDDSFFDVFSDKNNFYKRCCAQDLEKSVFSYFKEKKSEWLIIDFATMRKELISTETGLATAIFPEKAPLLKEKGLIGNYTLVDPRTISIDVQHKRIDAFLNKILEIYDESHIIIIDLHAVDLYVDNKTHICNYFRSAETGKTNPLSQQTFSYVKSIMKKSHYIPFPEKMVGDANHKWGKCELHYVSEYYEYALKAISIITNNTYSLSLEASLIESLKEYYNGLVEKNYANIYRNTIESLTNELSIMRRFKQYEKIFKEIALYEYQNRILQFFLSKHITHCAFYGFSEISKYLISLIFHKNLPISIDYIVENMEIQQYEGIPFIKRSSALLPDVPFIIIGDLSSDIIRKKLQKMNSQWQIFDYADLTREE